MVSFFMQMGAGLMRAEGRAGRQEPALEMFFTRSNHKLKDRDLKLHQRAQNAKFDGVRS